MSDVRPLMERWAKKLRPLLTQTDDDEFAVCQRALKLYEFQTAIFFPGETGADKLRVRQAGLFATVKLLEFAEDRLEQQLGRSPQLQDLAGDGLYSRLFDEEFLYRGGWNRARYSVRATKFDRDRRVRILDARGVAAMIGFSYGFDPAQVSANVWGGVTSAWEYVPAAPENVRLDLSVRQGAPKWRPFVRSTGSQFSLRP